MFDNKTIGHYAASMRIVANRFALIEGLKSSHQIVEAEIVALNLRKIVEGVSFGALSAVELQNARDLEQLRSKDPKQLLEWLERRSLLRLPSAQNISSSPDYNFIASGAGARDLTVTQLARVYSITSEILHERHPSRLAPEYVQTIMEQLNDWAVKLRGWLWDHIMFLEGQGILVQMGAADPNSFCIPISKEAAYRRISASDVGRFSASKLSHTPRPSRPAFPTPRAKIYPTPPNLSDNPPIASA